METHPYLFTLIYLGGFTALAFGFYLIMRQINSRGSALSDMLIAIEEIKVKVAAIEPPKPFMKHAEDVFSDILHHDNDKDKPMDLLLDKLKRAPDEPMNVKDRAELKEKLDERKDDTTRPEKERKVAGIMGDMMDLVLEEASSQTPVSNPKMVGIKVETPEQAEEPASTD